MYIGHIIGFAFLPVSVILFLNLFGITRLTSLFGLDIMFIAAIGLVLIQIGDIIDSHLKGEFVVLYWIAGIILCLPTAIFFTSKLISYPAAVITPLPIIITCFLFVEGLSSFFIGQ